MKKKSQKEILRLKRINIKARRHTHGNLILKASKNLLRRESRIQKIYAPRSFSLSSASTRNNTITFINSIWEIIRSGKIASINFRETSELLPCGTILVAANIFKALRKYPGRVIAFQYPENEVVEQMLQHIELLQCLGLGARKTIDHDMVVNWNFYQKPYGAFEDDFESFSNSIDRYLNQDESELLTGISEAVSNTQDHAYQIDATMRPWWLFSSVKDNLLSVAVCDLGVGIASSLPKNVKEKFNISMREFFETLQMTSSKKESTMIKAALEFRRSRMNTNGSTHRGKGLSQMLSVANEVPESTFIVHSNKGMYAYRNRGENADRNFSDFKSSISGTVVLWSVPLKAAKNEQIN